jgi:hypothetical protein
MAYGAKIDALREKYSDFLWDGEFVGTVGANVRTENGNKVLFSVFINHKTNKRAIVVANALRDKPIEVEAGLGNSKGRFLMATPEAPEAKESHGKVKIPAMSVVVLFEK